MRACAVCVVCTCVWHGWFAHAGGMGGLHLWVVWVVCTCAWYGCLCTCAWYRWRANASAPTDRAHKESYARMQRSAPRLASAAARRCSGPSLVVAPVAAAEPPFSDLEGAAAGSADAIGRVTRAAAGSADALGVCFHTGLTHQRWCCQPAWHARFDCDDGATGTAEPWGE